VAAVLLSIWFGVSAACNENSPAPTAKSERSAPAIRPVRVQIASRADEIRLRVDGGYTVVGPNARSTNHEAQQKWTTVTATSSGTLRFGDDLLQTRRVFIVPRVNGTIRVALSRNGEWMPTARYFGSFSLRAHDEGQVEVINNVDIESYVACVVAREVSPVFHDEAYRAQAIVARTYALYQMHRRKDEPYDVSADESSQVYIGITAGRTGQRAWLAAEYTRGIVCTFRQRGLDRLFPTYYHAACGGVTQSEAAFRQADAVEPLAGGVECDYCKIAPGQAYRWGPTSIPVDDVAKRLRARYDFLADLRRIVAIEVSGRHAGGRPLRLRLRDSAGASFEIQAERFRLAVGADVMPSAYCDISVDSDAVSLRNGKGFGHGVGLCQWGMQGQALSGRRAADILRYYYPGSKLTRAY